MSAGASAQPSIPTPYFNSYHCLKCVLLSRSPSLDDLDHVVLKVVERTRTHNFMKDSQESGFCSREGGWGEGGLKIWGIFSSLFSLRSSWLATESERDHPPKKRKQAQISHDQTPVTNSCRLFLSFLKECGSGWHWPGLVLAMLNVLQEGDKRDYPRSASCRAALKRSSKGILRVLKQLFHPPHSHPMHYYCRPEMLGWEFWAPPPPFTFFPSKLWLHA